MRLKSNNCQRTGLFRKSIKGLLVLLALFFLQTAFAAPPAADETNAMAFSGGITKTYPFSQMGWDSAVTLNGYQPDYTFYFPTGRQQKMQRAVLHLKLSYPQSLSPDTSIVIKFNQSIISQLSIPASSSTTTSEWDIELPVNQFNKDWQAINFSAHLVSSKNLCDPAIWIYISPETSLTLTYETLPFTGTLNQLPLPFINPTSIDPVPTLLVLPKAPTNPEILALFQVVQRLGQLAGDSKTKLQSITADQLTDAQQKNNNLLFIGLANQLFNTPGYFQDALKTNNQVQSALHDKAGVIMLTQSAMNPMFGLLVLTGADLLSLQQAVSAFLTTEFTQLTAGQLAVINQISLKPRTPDRHPWYRATFKKLGYDNKSVSGLGSHKVSYKIPLPADRIPGNATLKTYITAPVLPGQALSQITLLVNGQRQSTMWLKKEQSSWSIDIKADLLKPGDNILDFLIELHQDNEECTRKNYYETWALIQSASYFEGSFQDGTPKATLNQLPVPFGDSFSIILPDNLSNETISNLTDFFFTLGNLFLSTTQTIEIKTANSVDEDYIRNHSLIIIGTPATNRWIPFTLDFLPVQIEDTSRILNTKKQYIQTTSDLTTGLLELVQSPWSENNAVLIITGNTEQALTRALQSISDNKIRATFNGNVVFINSDESFGVISSYGNRYLNLKHRFTRFIYNVYRNTLYTLKYHPQILIYVLAFIVPLVILYRRRKK